jgi:hypothetical protein
VHGPTICGSGRVDPLPAFRCDPACDCQEPVEQRSNNGSWSVAIVAVERPDVAVTKPNVRQDHDVVVAHRKLRNDGGTAPRFDKSEHGRELDADIDHERVVVSTEQLTKLTITRRPRRTTHPRPLHDVFEAAAWCPRPRDCDPVRIHEKLDGFESRPARRSVAAVVVVKSNVDLTLDESVHGARPVAFDDGRVDACLDAGEITQRGTDKASHHTLESGEPDRTITSARQSRHSPFDVGQVIPHALSSLENHRASGREPRSLSAAIDQREPNFSLQRSDLL